MWFPALVVALLVLAYAVWAVSGLFRRERYSAGPEPDAAAFAGCGPTVLPVSGHRSPEDELAGLSPEAIELLLDEHYRQVLSDPAARKVWRKLLADAAAVERYARVGC